MFAHTVQPVLKSLYCGVCVYHKSLVKNNLEILCVCCKSTIEDVLLNCQFYDNLVSIRNGLGRVIHVKPDSMSELLVSRV